MIGLRLAGNAAVAGRLGGFPDRLQRRLVPAMAQFGSDLQNAVAANLAGGVLQRRSGRLAAAQSLRLEQQGDRLSVGVGFDVDAAPYGAIQEFGGTTRAHLIAAKAAKALAFSLGGRLVLAKRVNHPGSRIPAHFFLRSALAAGAPAMVAAMRDAVSAEVAA